MQLQVQTTSLNKVSANWLIVPIGQDRTLTTLLSNLDEALGGTLSRLIEAEDITGKTAACVALPDVPGFEAQRLLIVGLGEDTSDTRAFNKALGTAARRCSKKDNVTVAVAIDPELQIAATDQARLIARAMQVGGVGQGVYRTEPNRFALESVVICTADDAANADVEAAAQEGSTLGEAINLTRDLVNLPADDIYPESFAARAEAMVAEVGSAKLRIEVLDQPQLEAENMGSLLAVARGSDRPPRVVAIHYRGGADDGPVLGLCGKGVTFDSGGLSLKTSDGMKAMKCDMAGAATVLGAMSAIARLGLPVNVTGYMGLVENMVSGNSYKLGDVLKARNGVTIEVHNTDAEGRLVLADVLSYAADAGCAKLVDLATLTGSCVVALGEEVVGVFSNNDDWSNQVQAAAHTASEFVWPMPMFDHFNDQLKSDVSDVKNVGTRWGGSITAAKFLERFVDDVPWVHLDIAGPAFAASNKPHREGGATGVMVQTLVELAREFG